MVHTMIKQWIKSATHANFHVIAIFETKFKIFGLQFISDAWQNQLARLFVKEEIVGSISNHYNFSGDCKLKYIWWLCNNLTIGAVFRCLDTNDKIMALRKYMGGECIDCGEENVSKQER
jgi:hypothetical protein